MTSRRHFLHTLAATAALAAAPRLMAATHPAAERRLSLYNLHTGESLDSPYWADGRYLDGELAAFNRLLRDHRSGEVASIDPKLLDQLHALQQLVGQNGSYHVISGYRSPQSNALLRRTSSGVAKRSFHMLGRAIDIRLPGVGIEQLHRAALQQQAGGVGYYAKSGFIHLDTGRPRSW